VTPKQRRVEAKFWISRIKAELEVSICKSINMVTLFDLSRNCAVYVRQELSGPKTLTPTLGENFENI